MFQVPCFAENLSILMIVLLPVVVHVHHRGYQVHSCRGHLKSIKALNLLHRVVFLLKSLTSACLKALPCQTHNINGMLLDPHVTHSSKGFQVICACPIEHKQWMHSSIY